MDRRKSIKALLFGTASSGVLIEACKNSDKKVTENSTVQPFTGPDRMAEEIAYYKEISTAPQFLQIMRWQQLRFLLI